MKHDMHTPFARRLLARQRGFTLVELMVGLLLGMITVLVISEVLAVSEGRQRTIDQGSDAMTNGALALYTLQREIQQSGYGAVIDPSSLGCPINGQYRDPDAPAEQPALNWTPTLAPVVITDGADGAPDAIAILQSRKPTATTPIPIIGHHAKSDSFFSVKSSFGTSAGDLMIAVPQGGLYDATNKCAVFTVTNDGAATPGDTTLSQTRIPHVTGTSKWNRDTVFPDSGYAAGSYLLNMGTLSSAVYEIQNLAMVSTSRTSESANSTAEVLYPQIVNLQALYGKAPAGSTQVNEYDNTAPVNSIEWQRVLAIRVAIVARSTQYEKEEVTMAAPKWDVGSSATVAGSSTCGDSNCITLKIDHVPDWKHYRYRVFETIVPLRNVLWNAAGGS